MASNTIKFNNRIIELRGVMLDKEKVSYCKGIKLNGTDVVSFDSTAGILYWQEYTNDYNAIWTSDEPEIYSRRLAKATMENEFAITRSKWLLFNKTSLFDEAGIKTKKLFDFNSDGKLYSSDEDLASVWEKIKEILPSSKDRLTIASNPDIDLVKMLRGLPLLYKGFNSNDPDYLYFKNTGIIEGIQKTSSSGNWTVGIGDLGSIIDYQGNVLTITDIKSAIEKIIGSNRASVSGSTINIQNSSEWDAQGICNFLSNVYLEGFGPYGALYEGVDNQNQALDQGSYFLEPNSSFNPSEYWVVSPEYMIPIEIKYVTYDQGCDFYILTAWGETQVPSTVDLSSDYSIQGENNALVNVLYFDTSSLADLKYPNILVEMSTVFNQSAPTVLYQDEDLTQPIWESIRNGYGYVFPSDCPYDIDNSLYITAPQITPDEWVSLNKLSSITWSLDQSVESDYDCDYLAPTDVATSIFEWYMESFPDQFPSGTGESGGSTKTFKLKLKLRAYPAYAETYLVVDDSTEHWYLNAYDPYNVGGYYPVTKTMIVTAGDPWTTRSSYMVTPPSVDSDPGEILDPKIEFSEFNMDLTSYVGQAWSEVANTDSDHFLNAETTMIFIPERTADHTSYCDYRICKGENTSTGTDSYTYGSVAPSDTVTGKEFLILRAKGTSDDETVYYIYLGDNNVKANAEGIKHEFTATLDGDYVFSSTSSNAYLGYLEGDVGSDVVYPEEMPITKHLSVGDKFIVLCSTQDFSDDEYTLTIIIA